MFVQCTGLHGLAKQDGLQNKVFSPKKAISTLAF